jgi:hypothetical protein
MIFKNIENLNYIGKFGNSNPHYINDWLLNNKEDNKDSSNFDPFVNRTGTCKFPSTMVV